MKKLFTTAFAIMLCASMASAQRVIDITVEVVSPPAGGTVTDQVPFDMEVKVTNTGPDDMKVGDSLVYFLVIGNQIQNKTELLTNNLSLFNGASQNFIVEDIVIQGNQGGTFSLCALVVLIQRTGVDTVRDNVAGGNNVGCNTVTFANPKGLDGLDEFQSTLYPNPVTGDKAIISFESPEVGEASVRVYDLAGKTVAQHSVNVFGGNQEVEIEAGNLKNGVYVYEIKMGETVTRNKFSVNR